MSIEYQEQGDVGVITINRPDRFNAIEATVSTGMIEALSRAGSQTRSVVITGAGRAFSSGADLAELEADYDTGGPDLGEYLEIVFHPMVHAVVDSPVPTIAAINGVAAGAGLGLALACDLRVMASSAYLTSAFTAIGLAPDSGTTWWLSQMLGVSKALEIALTNRRLEAEECLDLGLCVEVAPQEETVDRAVQVGKTLADLVPDSLVTTRRLIRGASGLDFSSALEAERVAQGRLGKTPEHAEGVRAFLEKRKPDFRNAAGQSPVH